MNSPCLLILLIYIKHKTRWNFGLAPRVYFLKWELIHWVDKVKTCDQQSGSCSGILAINTKLPRLGLHIRILNSPCLILFTHTKHKTIRSHLGQTPHLHFLEGRELSHWVGKAKNLWLIVGQLCIKAAWWDTPLVLWDFSWSNKQDYFSTNAVVTFIVFSKSFSNLVFTCTRRFKNSFFYNGFIL